MRKGLKTTLVASALGVLAMAFGIHPAFAASATGVADGSLSVPTGYNGVPTPANNGGAGLGNCTDGNGVKGESSAYQFNSTDITGTISGSGGTYRGLVTGVTANGTGCDSANDGTGSVALVTIPSNTDLQGNKISGTCSGTYVRTNGVHVAVALLCNYTINGITDKNVPTQLPDALFVPTGTNGNYVTSADFAGEFTA